MKPIIVMIVWKITYQNATDISKTVRLILYILYSALMPKYLNIDNIILMQYIF